jgi:hypothetical protein
VGSPKAGCGRPGAVGCPHRGAARSSGHRPASPLGSPTPLVAVPRRLTPRIGAPQVGQRAASRGGGRRGGGGPSPGCAGTIIRRRVARGRAHLAWSQPQGRTCPQPSGQAAAAQRDGVELGRTEAGPAPCTGGARNRAVREADAAAVGAGAPAAIRGAGGAGGGAVRLGRTRAVPGEGPHVGGAGLQPAGVAPLGCAEGSGEGGVVGARRSAKVGQARWRTCGETKRRPLEPMRLDAGARPSTFFRCRQSRCSARAERRAGAVWEP